MLRARQSVAASKGSRDGIPLEAPRDCLRVVVRALRVIGMTDGDRACLPPIKSAKIAGTTSNVATVDISSPPITAQPSGACISLPRSSASAIGTIPMVIAEAVIRIGRTRSAAPTAAASVAQAPPSSARS